MKSGPVKKSDAISVAKTDYVCGVNPINWNANNEAAACDFYGKDLSNSVTAKSNCGVKCQQTAGCTHYSWTTLNLALLPSMMRFTMAIQILCAGLEASIGMEPTGLFHVILLEVILPMLL